MRPRHGILEDRCAVVTGGAMGIGRAVTEHFVSERARVAVIDLEPPPRAGEAVALQYNLEDVAGIPGLARELEARLGPIDILVNCAAAFEHSLATDVSIESYRRVMAVNLDAPVFLARALAPSMVERGYGRIVNITSVEGSFAASGSLAYAVAKSGLNQATRILAVELSRFGVLVNAIAPGFVRTRMAPEIDTDSFRRIYIDDGMLPMGRAAEAHEIAAHVAWLASESNSYMTGQVVAVDGGLTSTLFPS